jgi:signal transduction histidine kinase
VKRLLEWTHNRNTSFEPVDVEKLIKEVLWLVGPTLEKHSIAANLASDRRFPLIESNREGLQQVFLNLINNSVDAMPKGGRITITTRLAPSGDAEIDFQDTGSGIDRDHIQHLFEPMWTTKPSGGGFGLAIARETLAEHSGDIQVIESQDIGAGFRLILPIKQRASAVLRDGEAIPHVA